MHGHVRRRRRDGLAANGVGRVLPIEDDGPFPKTHVEARRRPRERDFVIDRHAGSQGLERNQAIQRPAVEIVEAKDAGDTCSDRALAGGGRAVDGDDVGHFARHRVTLAKASK